MIPLDTHILIAFTEDDPAPEMTTKYFNTNGRERKFMLNAMIATTVILPGGKLATRNISDFELF